MRLDLLNVDAELALVCALEADDGEAEAATLRLEQLDVLDLAALGCLIDGLPGCRVQELGGGLGSHWSRRWRDLPTNEILTSSFLN